MKIIEVIEKHIRRRIGRPQRAVNRERRGGRLAAQALAQHDLESVTRRYVHYHFDVEGIPVELSVYDRAELYITRYSSIDGKPIDRVPRRRVVAMLASTRG